MTYANYLCFLCQFVLICVCFAFLSHLCGNCASSIVLCPLCPNPIRTIFLHFSFLSHICGNSISSIVLCPLCPNPIRTILLRIAGVCPPPFFLSIVSECYSAALFLLLACFLCLFPLDGCLPLCGEGSLCELREVYLQAGRQGGHSWRPNATAAQRGFIGFFLIKIAKNIIFSLSKICIYQKFFVPLHPICKKYRLPTNYQSYPHSLSAVRASRCHPRPYIF